MALNAITYLLTYLIELLIRPEILPEELVAYGSIAVQWTLIGYLVSLFVLKRDHGS